MGSLRRSPWLAVIAAALLLGALASPVAAAAPANDNFANATVAEVPFSDNPDMTEAALEAGEPRTCDNAESMDASVWYQVVVPRGYALRVETGGEVGVVMAALFGPYSEVPSTVDGLGEPRGCVNTTDDGSYVREDVLHQTRQSACFCDFMRHGGDSNDVVRPVSEPP